jgi:hypothetical protein
MMYFADSLRKMGFVEDEKKAEDTFCPSTKMFLTVTLMLPRKSNFWPL